MQTERSGPPFLLPTRTSVSVQSSIPHAIAFVAPVGVDVARLAAVAV